MYFSRKIVRQNFLEIHEKVRKNLPKFPTPPVPENQNAISDRDEKTIAIREKWSPREKFPVSEANQKILLEIYQKPAQAGKLFLVCWTESQKSGDGETRI